MMLFIRAIETWIEKKERKSPRGQAQADFHRQVLTIGVSETTRVNWKN
jgi:hypothetical protein